MRATPIIGIATGLAVLGAVGVAAQQQDHMAMPMDTRQPLDFPTHMHKHMLMNMRSHFEALGEIVAALGEGNGAKASNIANERLGLQSPAAAACLKPGTKPDGANMSPMGDMAAMMAEYMPPHMREMGYAMHEFRQRVRRRSGEDASGRRRKARVEGLGASDAKLRRLPRRVPSEIVGLGAKAPFPRRHRRLSPSSYVIAS